MAVICNNIKQYNGIRNGCYVSNLIMEVSIHSSQLSPSYHHSSTYIFSIWYFGFLSINFIQYLLSYFVCELNPVWFSERWRSFFEGARFQFCKSAKKMLFVHGGDEELNLRGCLCCPGWSDIYILVSAVRQHTHIL